MYVKKLEVVSFRNIKTEVLEPCEGVNLIYGNKNGGSNKYNSYILQAQLSPSIETLMNAGDRIDANRIRMLHPQNYSNINEEYSKTPKPTECAYKTYCGT